jgi:serine/threonine-protein kinase ATR
MEDEDIEILLETTFFIVDHYWQSFDRASRDKSVALFDALLGKSRHVVKASITKLPSLGHIPELAELDKALQSLREKTLDNETAFGLFAQRLNHENSGVVLQTLNELAGYLKQNQSYLQASAISQKPDPVVVPLSRALLDCSAKYNGLQSDIARLCAECIGLVGCLDANRLESTREQVQFVVTDNFVDAGETTDFVAFMMDTVLVKSFLSATDTRYIGFLSFALQELLDRCDFKVAYAEQGKGTSASIYRKWLALKDTTKEALAPLLTSRYVLAPMAHQPVEYPIFRPTRGYGNWLRAFVLDLLHKGQNPFSEIIFEPLCRVIRVKDVSIAEFLLPYLVVHVVVGQERTPDLRTKILGEMLAILNYEPGENSTYVER